MSRLLPSHPLSRYAPYEFRDKVDVLGEHLIWTGTMAGRRNDRGRNMRHGLFYTGGTTRSTRSSESAHRLAWRWITGEELTDEYQLWRKPSCIHERCIAPGCFDKVHYSEIPDMTRERQQRVS
jgi:hypothetical protein